jgi:2'-5' RNA ligase
MARHTDWEFGQWHLNEVMLVRSILTDQGAIYEPVSRSKLGGN